MLALLSSACSCPGPNLPDGGPPDAGPPDSGLPDAGKPDAGPPDGGPHDAGTVPDAGARRCVSVSCVGDTTCSPEDGECRCNGTLCAFGQTCTCPLGQPGCQPQERICDSSTRCDGVSCDGGTSCDLSDGLCKCPGSGGPVCTDDQLCGASRPAQCVGGCASSCGDGMSCDSQDGTCRCGGHGGSACADGEVCVSLATQYLCRLRCAPNGPCPPEQACFIDTRPTLDVAYCDFPTALLPEGATCTRPTQCFDGVALHCAGLSDISPVGTCRASCDPSAPLCAAGRHCIALVDVPDAGFCVP